MELKIETIHRIDLTELTRFIAEAKGVNYREAEAMIPSEYIDYDYSTISADDKYDLGEDMAWAEELREEMKIRGIDTLSVYQDC